MEMLHGNASWKCFMEMLQGYLKGYLQGYLQGYSNWG